MNTIPSDLTDLTNEKRLNGIDGDFTHRQLGRWCLYYLELGKMVKHSRKIDDSTDKDGGHNGISVCFMIAKLTLAPGPTMVYGGYDYS